MRQRLTKRRRSRYDRPELASEGSRLLAKLVGRRRVLYGVPLIFMPKPGHTPSGNIGSWQVENWSAKPFKSFKSAREAVVAFLSENSPSRRHGPWSLRRTKTHWEFGDIEKRTIFLERPTRLDLAEAIREFRRHDSKPSYAKPSTLGWRTFSWDRHNKCLKSPSQGTLWESNELIVNGWTDEGAVRGRAGIHACRLPRGDWKLADRPADMPTGICVALVERFERFVLGKEGWRAEWVIIKELLAPNPAVARTLQKLYPDVKVWIAERNHWLVKEL